MKTPTLIVRLLGLYLLVTCTISLMQIRQAQSFAGSGGLGTQQQSIVSNLQLYAIIGLIVGAAAARFAGPLARLLTFDAEPKKAEVDLADRLLSPKDGQA